MLIQMRHPNLVHFHGITHDATREKLSFVLSWADNGSLYDYLHVHGNALDLVTSLRVVAEVAAGMAYLHANNVVHRNLKSPNVLLDDALCAKINFWAQHLCPRPPQDAEQGCWHAALGEPRAGSHQEAACKHGRVLVWRHCVGTAPPTAGHGTTASLHQMGQQLWTLALLTGPTSTCLWMARSTGVC